jgi:hypothetical protein
MPIETADYISQLVPSQPQGGESISEGDDHLRTIKRAVQKSFPKIDSEVSCTPAELNKVGQMASDIAALQSQVGDAYHGNVASCYYNAAAIGNPFAPDGIIYEYNIREVQANGTSTKVIFRTPLTDFDDGITAHFAFTITPVQVAGVSGVGSGPIVINVVGATKEFVSFKAWQLNDAGNWAALDGGKASFSMMVTDMADGQ